MLFFYNSGVEFCGEKGTPLLSPGLGLKSWTMAVLDSRKIWMCPAIVHSQSLDYQGLRLYWTVRTVDITKKLIV